MMWGLHEPLLTPIESLGFQQKGNNADKARLDISARGVWSTFERTFFDVRIFNPKSVSYQSRTMPQLYALHEDEKKSQYMNRVHAIYNWRKGHSSPLYLPLQEEWHLRPGVSLGDLLL